MAIEFPSKPDVLDPIELEARLAALEDAQFAEQLMRENPALFAPEPPRTQREILAWTTRRWGTTLLAVTAALSLAAGYLGNELSRGRAVTPTVAPQAAAVVAPSRHAPPAARHDVARPPIPLAHSAAIAPHVASAPVPHNTIASVRHHAAAPVQHHALAALQHHANAPVRHHASTPVAHHAIGPQSAAAQLAAWEAANPASRSRTSPATAAEPAPRTQPRSEPATATETATTTASTTQPVTTTTTPGGAPDPGPGGVKTPPTNPGGVWTERIPGGGTLGGSIGPVIGVPRDSCTPRGGRTGIVMEAISVLMSSRH